MADIPVPPGAIGRTGMVAMLRRVQGIDDGKIVAVRMPVGFVTTLVGATKPVFAWQVLMLGEPVSINGKPTRDVIVADRCLRPVSQITPAEVEEIVKTQGKVEFDAALKDLAKIMGARPSDEANLEAMVDKAAQQFGHERALEVVPIATALFEVGFKRVDPINGKSLMWAGVHAGTEIEVFAGANWFNRWALAAKCVSARTAMWDELTLPAELPRGEVVALLVEYWREAFGRDAPTPDAFEIGLIYLQAKEELRQIAPGLPSVRLDGEILRATRKWMLERHGGAANLVGPQPDTAMALSCERGLLTIKTQGATYGCPIRTGWIDECTLSLRSFLAVPPWGFKGWNVTLSATLDGIWIGHWHIATMPALCIPPPTLE